MKRRILFLIILIFGSLVAYSQQISKEYLLHLTREWKGERFSDGRPKVPDALLVRLKNRP
jgi:hypothetical protein